MCATERTKKEAELNIYEMRRHFDDEQSGM